METVRTPAVPRLRSTSGARTRKRLWNDRYLYLMVLPGLIYYIIYRYIPMAGVIIAFKDYSPFLGFFDSPWVGFQYFQRIFTDPDIWRVLNNTLVLSFLQIAFAFPAPVVLAILLNEVRNYAFKRTIQSIIYLPHFLSWVVVISIVTIFLRGDGLVNSVLKNAGVHPLQFLTDPMFFRPLVVLEVIWKETGWGTILFLAALSGVNLDLYEAANMDGASRWQLIWHITLPQLRGIIVILLILRLGTVLDSGFEQLFLMQNPLNLDVSNVLDTFVYYQGIQQGDFGFSAAVGLLKGVVGMILVVGSNYLAKRGGESGLY